MPVYFAAALYPTRSASRTHVSEMINRRATDTDTHTRARAAIAVHTLICQSLHTTPAIYAHLLYSESP